MTDDTQALSATEESAFRKSVASKKWCRTGDARHGWVAAKEFYGAHADVLDDVRVQARDERIAKLEAQLAEARDDQRRLEWLVKNECFVSWLTKDECYVADVAGIMEAPTSSIGWRDAIDKAMALSGSAP